MPRAMLFRLGRPDFSACLLFPGFSGSSQEHAGTVQTHVNSQSAGTQAAQPEDVQERVSGARELPAAARRLHARLYDHTEEAKLGSAQGREGAPDERL